MKILVTGGAGFIGSNVALALEERGGHVTVVDDFSSGDFVNLKRFRGEVIAQDVNCVDWDRLGHFDAVFHHAALTDTTVTDQKKMMYVNVEGFRKVLDFCMRRNSKLIYASSAGVYGNGPAPQSENGPKNPLNSYAYSKWVGDQTAQEASRKSRTPIIGLRYFNVYGMGEQNKGTAASMVYRLAEQMQSGKRPRIFFDGEQSRDLIYVKDVIAANLKALESSRSGIVNIGTGRGTTFNRLIEVLNEVFETRLAPDYFDNPYGFYQNETRADTRQAESLIGFKSRFSIEEGIRDYFSLLYGISSETITSA